MKTSKCLGIKCLREIHFIKIRHTGKQMPCETTRLSSTTCAPGTVLVTDDGCVVTVKGNELIPVEGYESHYARCPHATNFKRR